MHQSRVYTKECILYAAFDQLIKAVVPRPPGLNHQRARPATDQNGPGCWGASPGSKHTALATPRTTTIP